MCAYVCQDSQAMLWDLNEGKHLYTLDGGGDTINALCFSPNRYWLCAATGPSIKIWVCGRHCFLTVVYVLRTWQRNSEIDTFTFLLTYSDC